MNFATIGGYHPVFRDHDQVDRLPFEAILGWDATLNGNLAELLQEPSLMGAYEGANHGVAKGVKFPRKPSTMLSVRRPRRRSRTTRSCSPRRTAANSGANSPNPFPSNFQCNPSSIDGLTVTDSSQGGGGIFVHAWAHNLQIANNRVYNNTGTLPAASRSARASHPELIQGATTP